ncbi:MAG TPA: hypothetical protein VER17_02275 [Tepidisphaeraceae bacterium]|nr:hypothetical protein [Tepidisphaeraceae bacterium]
MAALSWASPAAADAVLFEFAKPYTSNIVPAPGGGGPPYMTALFEDIVGQPGKVRLTLSTFGLTAPSEFVSDWYFNLNPILDVSKLAFQLDAGATTAVTTSNYAFVKDANSLDLGGQAVGFDFGADFLNANNPDKRFSADELFVGTITTTQIGANLSASSFLFKNAGDGMSDIFFYGIAKVQGLANDQSTKLGAELPPPPPVPLPAAVWAGFALMGALGLNRFRRRGSLE